jgi:hypothetical protein
MGEARKRALASGTKSTRARYARGRVALAYRHGDNPDLDAAAFLSLVEAEIRVPATLRPFGAGMSDKVLDALMMAPSIDDRLWHVFDTRAGYVGSRDDLPDGLVRDGGAPHRFHEIVGEPLTLVGSVASGFATEAGDPVDAATLSGLVRLRPDGVPVCEVDAPLAIQAMALRASGDVSHAHHLDVLRSMVSALAPTDPVAAADLRDSVRARGDAKPSWRASHQVRVDACEAWIRIVHAGGFLPFARGLGTQPTAWTPLDGDLAPAVANRADLIARLGVGVPVNAHTVRLDAVATARLREWIAGARGIAGNRWITVAARDCIVAALIEGVDGFAAVAWSTRPPAGSADLGTESLEGADLGPLGGTAGIPVGAAIAGRFSDPDGFMNYAPAALLKAHAEGSTLGDLAEAIGARVLADRARSGAMASVVSATSTSHGEADPWLERVLSRDTLDWWSGAAPGILMADLSALRMAEARGATLVDLAREALLGVPRPASTAA